MKSRGFTIWLTGMNASGKSTLARYLGKRLPLIDKKVEILDQNELEAFFPDAPDTPEEIRNRNDRQLGWMARLLTRHDVVTVVAAVSANRQIREEIRREIGRFFEVFVDSPFEVLQERDERGIYERALEGKLQNVIGVHTPYEPPNLAELRLDSSETSVENLAEAVFAGLYQHGFITRDEREILIGGSAASRLRAVRAAAKRVGGRSKASVDGVKAKTKEKVAEAKEKVAEAKKKVVEAAKKARSKASAKKSEPRAKAPAVKATKATPAKTAKAASTKTKIAPAKSAKAASAKATKTAPAKSAKTASAKASKAAPAKSAKAASAKATQAAPAKSAKTPSARTPKAVSVKTTKAASAKAGKAASTKSAKAAPAKTAAKKASRTASTRAKAS